MRPDDHRSDERLPALEPQDLGEAAAPERVERLWSRLDASLPLHEVRRRRSPSLFLVAAALGLFVGGVAFGIGIQRRAAPGALVVATSELPTGSSDVLAAGSEPRRFELPGGTQLSLGAQSLVEVVRGPDGGITLRLLHGEASVDARDSLVAMLAGDTRLSAPSGSVMRVRRSEEEVDVSVTGGRVDVSAPGGTKQLISGEHGSFPIHATVVASAVDDRPQPNSKAVRRAKKRDDRPTELQVATSLPEWRVKFNQGDLAGALAVLRTQPGGLAGSVSAASRADVLMDLAALAKSKGGGDPSLARQAYERVVRDFGANANAGVAAHHLADMYKAEGNVELERQYREKASQALADRPAFEHVQEAFEAGRVEEGRKRASEYLEKYPKGLYREQVQALVEEADEKGDKPAPPDDKKDAKPEVKSSDKPGDKQPPQANGDKKGDPEKPKDAPK